MKSLVVGDLHLGGFRFLQPFCQDPDDYVYKALDDVVAYAKENNVPNLILAGDIYDNPYPSQTDHRRLLKYLKNTGLNVYAIPGNHDVDETSGEGANSLLMPGFFTEEVDKNVKILLKPTLLKIDGIRVCFLPWPHTESLTKKPCVNIAHVTLSKAKSEHGRSLSGVKIKRNPNHYWWIGDLHTRQRYSERVHYIGMLCQKTFGESLPKGFSHITVKEENGELIVDDNWIPYTPPFELVNLGVDTIDDLEKLEEFNKDRPVLYKLKIKTRDFILPANFREQNPHVIQVEYPKGTKKVEVEGKLIEVNIKSPLKGLRDRLEKKGLSPKQINFGIRYAKERLKEIRNRIGE